MAFASTTLLRAAGALLVACGLTVPALASHDDSAGHEGEMTVHRPDDLPWQDGPASLPPGARYAVLEGDPSAEGLFVMRLHFPAGYQLPPHWHPKTERITVLEGTFHLGMGETFDAEATKPLPRGTYGYWPAGMRHFALALSDVVVQLHGVGPWDIRYVNPEDDPRNGQER